MPIGFARIVVIPLLLVLASPGLVHWTVAVSDVVAAEPRGKAGLARPAAGEAVPGDALPPNVAEMRAAILAAVESGRIEDLRTALDWNELKPEIADAPVGDAIDYWRQISVDGEGREILTILGEILQQPHAILPVGRDFENNRLYVWPRFSEAPHEKLTPTDSAAVERLVPQAVREEMARTGKYLWWRLAIGADGTWHTFTKAR